MNEYQQTVQEIVCALKWYRINQGYVVKSEKYGPSYFLLWACPSEVRYLKAKVKLL